jgi:hypothetical protein
MLREEKGVKNRQSEAKQSSRRRLPGGLRANQTDVAPAIDGAKLRLFNMTALLTF